MSVYVKARSVEAADDLEQLLVDDGFTYARRQGLKKLFTVKDIEPEEFTERFGFLAEDVQDLVEFSKPVEGIGPAYIPIAQNLSVQDSALGSEHSWALPRICRRSPPWDINNPPATINTTFECLRTGKGVDIYVLDFTGYKYTSPEFEGRMYRLDDGGQYDDSTSGDHGTWCSSCAAGRDYGVAKDATVWGVHATDFTVLSDPNTYIGLVDDVILHHNSRVGLNRPAVFSMSLGGFAAFPEILDGLIDAGIPVCVSAGNDWYDLDVGAYWPATSTADPDIIVVGATSMDDSPQQFSCFGNRVDIWSPGRWTKMQGTDAASSPSGTSFACPYVAGVIACMLEGYGHQSTRAQVQAIKAKLIANSTKNVLHGFENYQGKNNSGSFPNISYRVDNNRLLYIDPHVAIEPITGLTPA